VLEAVFADGVWGRCWRRYLCTMCGGGAGGGICVRCVGAVLEAVFVDGVWGQCVWLSNLHANFEKRRMNRCRAIY